MHGPTLPLPLPPHLGLPSSAFLSAELWSLGTSPYWKDPLEGPLKDPASLLWLSQAVAADCSCGLMWGEGGGVHRGLFLRALTPPS